MFNRFQKIKEGAEEVDSEYIQNYLFDNLQFAFRFYYINKEYFGGVLADIQYFFWKSIVAIFKGTFPCGMEFIDYSLQQNPEDRIITEGRIIETIKSDPNFIEMMDNILKYNYNQNKIKIKEGLNYKQLDLFLALNNTTISMVGNRKSEGWKFNITITDRYDFTDFKELNEYCDDNIIKGLLGSTANNMAMISVASGVMHEYNITIKFDMDILGI